MQRTWPLPRRATAARTSSSSTSRRPGSARWRWPGCGKTMRASAEAGVGILVTTHVMQEADERDRRVIMAAGRVVAEGTVAEVVGDASVAVVEGPEWERA